METRRPPEIVLSFNKTINSLISKLERRCVTPVEKADLDRLRQRINLLRKTHINGGQALLEEAGPFLFQYSDKIINREEAFFLDMNIRACVEHEIKKEDEFVFSLIDNVKAMYKKAKQVERDEVYAEVLSLHTDYIGFCIVGNLDPENPKKK